MTFITIFTFIITNVNYLYFTNYSQDWIVGVVCLNFFYNPFFLFFLFRYFLKSNFLFCLYLFKVFSQYFNRKLIHH